MPPAAGPPEAREGRPGPEEIHGRSEKDRRQCIMQGTEDWETKARKKIKKKTHAE